MSGFTGTTHTPEARAKIGAASKEHGATPRPPISQETRARLRAAKLGVPKSAEHRAAIAAGLRRWGENALPDQRRRGIRRKLNEAELSEYLLLQRKGFRSDEALGMIGRTDLLRACEASEGGCAAAQSPDLCKPSQAPDSLAAECRPRLTASENAYRRHLVAKRRPVVL